MNLFFLTKEAFSIWKKFGIVHTARRINDYLYSIKKNIQESKLYKKTKPNQNYLTKNVLGNKMNIHLNDHGIHKELFLYGIHEPIATNFILKNLNANDIVLEIGANIGYYALIEAKICSHIYAVEPIKENIINLKKNLKLNKCQNIETYEMALGNTSGTQKIYISDKSNWHSFYKNGKTSETRDIKIDTVDNFLINKKHPTFIRMDVEGYELSILKGMERTLPLIKRLFIEIHSDIMTTKETKELINILKNNNFYPELIARYDRPGRGKIMPNNYIDMIYKGDKGNYEIFFKK